MKRLFIAIDLPSHAKEDLEIKKKEIKNSLDRNCVKWVDKENMHITLIFLGPLKKEQLSSLIFILQEIKEHSFDVFLDKICYFPEKRRNANMIWAKGESREVFSLQEKIKKRITKDLPLLKIPAVEDFSLHVTLGRIRKWEWRKIPLVEIPILEEDLQIRFTVNSFCLIESNLSKSGPAYKIIKTFNI